MKRGRKAIQVALVKTTIDGRQIEVERDRWALDVARELGIEIPALCHHPALEPYGACRLCVVEATRRGDTWLTTSCDLPIREGLSIRTDTPRVRQARKMALELMWAQAPDAEVIREMAREMGVEKPRFAARGEGKCILCGLCVRVCRDLVGASAISFTHRGPDRSVGPPFARSADRCIGCGACEVVCPTGHIHSVDLDTTRNLETWRTELEMQRCESCGRPFAPVRQMEFLQPRLAEHVPLKNLCPACRRTEIARRIAQTSVAASPRGAGGMKVSAQTG